MGSGLLVERLNRIGLGSRGDRDDRAGHEICEQSVHLEHDLTKLLVIPDGDDHEIGPARHLGRRLDRDSADIARLSELFVVDIAGGHLITVFDEMLHHREAHAPYTHDPHSRFLTVHSVLCRSASVCWD